jgi:hypothetical protein
LERWRAPLETKHPACQKKSRAWAMRSKSLAEKPLQIGNSRFAQDGGGAQKSLK